MLERLIIRFLYVFFLAAGCPAAIAAASASDDSLTSFLDSRDEDGVSLRKHGVRSWVRPKIEGHPHLGSLIVTNIKKAHADDNCGYLATKVVDSIKYHLAKRRGNDFASSEEVNAFMDMKDGSNGKAVLSETMRVLSNYTLAEGVMSGTLWTIDDQDHLISCLENIEMRLDEHSTNELGDILIQGDMAVTSSSCRYSEQNSKVAAVPFEVGTLNCRGVSGCQFAHPDEAVHFCNTKPECMLVMGKEEAAGCEGGLGCYRPMSGEPVEDPKWSEGGGRTYIKECPGSLLEVQDAAFSSLRNAGMRWHGGEIHYCFAADVSPLTQQSFHTAVERLQKQVPCLKFGYVQRIDDTKCENVPSIIVQSKHSGCWSYVGQVSGTDDLSWKSRSQPLNLGRGCELVGIALHQLGHALGMVHENARTDRGNVMKLNSTNIKDGQENHLKMTSDVVKYAWAGHGTCATRIGKTKVEMSSADCLAVQGLFESQITRSGDLEGSAGQCLLDLCETGTFYPAPPSSSCTSKVASMTIKMQRKDCLRGKGTQPATSDNSSVAWVSCGFDLCTDIGLHLAKPYACENKVAYGYISTTKADCTNMQGKPAAGAAAPTDWVQCYMDFCSGALDKPFDFLSLMMYSPHAFAKERFAKTLEPLGNHSAQLTEIMGQRMGFSGLDISHLGHMYGCDENIAPDFDSKDVSHRMITGEYFEYNGTCEDQAADRTGFDIHGEEGFMKHASCPDMKPHCKHDNETISDAVRKACPVTCLVCYPHHGIRKDEASLGACFDAVSTGIRFREGPQATCKDLINYCKHETIGSAVTTACKLSCGLCSIHVVGMFYGPDHKCVDAGETEEPKFTIAGKQAPCSDMEKFCQGHVESRLVRRKCALTCGACPGLEMGYKASKPDGVYIPNDTGTCNRRRRFGFCSTRRRRNV